jgi:hypothetical protein
MEAADAWGKAQQDTESLVALLREYATGLDLEDVSKDDGVRMVLDQMPADVRRRAQELIAMQDAYDVLGPLEEN